MQFDNNKSFIKWLLAQRKHCSRALGKEGYSVEREADRVYQFVIIVIVIICMVYRDQLLVDWFVKYPRQTESKINLLSTLPRVSERRLAVVFVMPIWFCHKFAFPLDSNFCECVRVWVCVCEAFIRYARDRSPKMKQFLWWQNNSTVCVVCVFVSVCECECIC